MDWKICFVILVGLIVFDIAVHIVFQHETNISFDCVKRLLLNHFYDSDSP